MQQSRHEDFLEHLSVFIQNNDVYACKESTIQRYVAGDRFATLWEQKCFCEFIRSEFINNQSDLSIFIVDEALEAIYEMEKRFEP